MIRRNWRNIFILVAFSTDAMGIAFSGLLAYYLREFLPGVVPFPLEVFVKLTLFSSLVIVSFWMVVGLYRGAFHLDTRKQYYLAGKAYVYAALIILSPLQIFLRNDFPLRFLAVFLALVPILFLLGRFALNRFNLFMQKRGYGIHRVLLVGYGDREISVFERFEGFPELGYEIKGIVSKKIARATKYLGGVIVPQYPFTDIGPIMKQERIDGVFIPSPAAITNGYASLVPVCKKQRVKLKVLSPEADKLLQLARVYDIAGITMYSPPRYNVEYWRNVLKRVFDVVGSATLILVLTPVFFVTSMAILLESGFPVFFKQRRAALKNGKIFHFYKFRSMVKNADEMKAGLFRQNESDGALFKIRDDPRMTRVGRFIRKFSIDELPQLFNVLIGNMSLVGPRPLPVGDYERLNEGQEFWSSIKDRAKVKPGMTGLWQVSGRSNIGFREMVLLDLYYVENQSFLFDLEILFATIPVVLFGKGAY
ncbi:MAG: sugar transferase [Bacteroidota bacterium]